MWPWEHLAFGYLLYSLAVRSRWRRLPTDWGTLVLAIATQLPDLIDKPLAWGLEVLPGGRSLAHSLLVAVPVTLAVYHLADRWGNVNVGIGFLLGYHSHLVGDAIYPLFLGGPPSLAFLLWPVLPPETLAGEAVGVTGHVRVLFARYLEFLQSPRGAVFLLLEAVLLGGVLALWNRDGRPGRVWAWSTPREHRSND